MNLLKLKKDNIRVTAPALLTYLMAGGAGVCAYSLAIHSMVTNKV